MAQPAPPPVQPPTPPYPPPYPPLYGPPGHVYYPPPQKTSSVVVVAVVVVIVIVLVTIVLAAVLRVIMTGLITDGTNHRPVVTLGAPNVSGVEVTFAVAGASRSVSSGLYSVDLFVNTTGGPRNLGKQFHDRRRPRHLHRELLRPERGWAPERRGPVPGLRGWWMASGDDVPVRTPLVGPPPDRVPELDHVAARAHTIAAATSSTTRSQYRHATLGGGPGRTKKSVSTGSRRFVMQFGFPHFRIPTARSGSRTTCFSATL